MYDERIKTCFASTTLGLVPLRREKNSNFIPPQSQDNDHNVSMFIILPEDSKNLNIVEANLHKFSISDLLNTGKMEEVEILLPKFKIESKLDLVEPLKEVSRVLC